jgi:outer membrane lipoprotein SlyB
MFQRNEIMRHLAKLWILTAFVGTLANTCQAQNQTRDGALMGGVAGALLGGVVGKQSNDTTEGALIGGAVGALAGGVIGNQRQQAERQRYYNSMSNRPIYYEQRTYVQAPAQRVVTTRRPVTTAEVINMTRSGVSDAVIVAHIQTNGVAMQPDVNDVILMNQEGVSDYVVTMMQQARTGYRAPQGHYHAPARVYQTYPQPAEVVVQEEYYVQPQPVYQTRQPMYTRQYYVDRRGF